MLQSGGFCVFALLCCYHNDFLCINLVLPPESLQNARLLKLVLIVFYRQSQNSLVFNFTCLDSIIRMLHDHNLMPGFEMMGNPSGYFTDLEDHSQITSFAELAYQLASRYIGLT